MSYSTFRELHAKNRYCRPEFRTDPVAMCLTDTMDRSFHFGGESKRTSGPQSENCQSLLSERCAQKWDGVCEYVYKHYGLDAKWPNNRKIINPLYTQWEAENGFTVPRTVGENLISNTVKQKYCSFEKCEIGQQNFSPFLANGVKTKTYKGECIPVCQVDPKTIDTDPVMERALLHPEATAPTLINICNTSKRKNIDLSGTRIGEMCERYLSSS